MHTLSISDPLSSTLFTSRVSSEDSTSSMSSTPIKIRRLRDMNNETKKTLKQVFFLYVDQESIAFKEVVEENS